MRALSHFRGVLVPSILGIRPLDQRAVATILRRFHLAMTGVWAVLVIPTVVLWPNSVLWVALMSVWANFASHFSAWQASRTEKREMEREQ